MEREFWYDVTGKRRWVLVFVKVVVDMYVHSRHAVNMYEE